jgi:CRISPR-associated protein Csd1
MIPELINLYDRLAAADDSHLAPYGYSRQRIGFSIVLNLDGSLHAIEDRRQEVPKGKKSVLKPSLLLVPGTGGRTSGIAANFLWDQPGYMLGFSPEDPKPKRTTKKFAAFRG